MQGQFSTGRCVPRMHARALASSRRCTRWGLSMTALMSPSRRQVSPSVTPRRHCCCRLRDCAPRRLRALSSVVRSVSTWRRRQCDNPLWYARGFRGAHAAHAAWITLTPACRLVQLLKTVRALRHVSMHAGLLAGSRMPEVQHGMHVRGAWRGQVTSSLDSEKRCRIRE